MLPPDRSIEKISEVTTETKPLSFARYSSLVLRRAGKEWWDEFGLNWKTAGKALVYAGTLYLWSRKVGTEAVVTAISGFDWSILIDAIPPTLITLGVFTTLFIAKAAYQLHSEETESRKKLSGLLLIEAAKNKTTFEVSTEIRESTVCLTDSGDVEDWRDATAFCLEAKLFIRYCNETPEAIRIHGLRLSIVNDVTATEYPLNSYLMRPTFQPPNAQENHYFLGFMLGGNELTEHYFHFFCLDVPTECALSVDKNSFLRVTLDAGNRKPYSVDLEVPWPAARNRQAKS